jgi:putative oxidoreductase
MSVAWNHWLGALGRIGLASLFILAGANKIFSYAPTAARMEEAGLSPSGLLLPATIALELVGGLMIALGLRWRQHAAIALCVFTIATNIFFHRFWELSGWVAQLELSLFFKNVAIAGALLYFAAKESPPRSHAQPPE